MDTRQEMSVIGVHFMPGGAFPFLGMPAAELSDTHIALETLWGPSAREIRERLCAATSPAERFCLLESALLARLSSAKERHYAVPFALDIYGQSGQTKTSLRVRDVARRIGLSQRRFIQVFKAEVGMTPKLFGRVQRFQKVLALLPRATIPDWARLAVECGYFDQSHLIHDFLEFSGFSPLDYFHRQHALLQQGVYIKRNHFPVTEQGQFFPMASPPAAI
jgi:AraC-like DNA-binding protein